MDLDGIFRSIQSSLGEDSRFVRSRLDELIRESATPYERPGQSIHTYEIRFDKPVDTRDAPFDKPTVRIDPRRATNGEATRRPAKTDHFSPAVPARRRNSDRPDWVRDAASDATGAARHLREDNPRVRCAREPEASRGTVAQGRIGCHLERRRAIVAGARTF